MVLPRSFSLSKTLRKRSFVPLKRQSFIRFCLAFSRRTFHERLQRLPNANSVFKSFDFFGTLFASLHSNSVRTFPSLSSSFPVSFLPLRWLISTFATPVPLPLSSSSSRSNPWTFFLPRLVSPLARRRRRARSCQFHFQPFRRRRRRRRRHLRRRRRRTPQPNDDDDDASSFRAIIIVFFKALCVSFRGTVCGTTPKRRDLDDDDDREKQRKSGKSRLSRLRLVVVFPDLFLHRTIFVAPVVVVVVIDDDDDASSVKIFCVEKTLTRLEKRV